MNSTSESILKPFALWFPELIQISYSLPKWRISCSLSGHIGPPSHVCMLTLDDWVCREHVVQSLLHTCLFWCPLLDPQLTAYHSNTGVHIIAMFRFRLVYFTCKLPLPWNSTSEEKLSHPVSNWENTLSCHFRVSVAELRCKSYDRRSQNQGFSLPFWASIT